MDHKLLKRGFVASELNNDPACNTESFLAYIFIDQKESIIENGFEATLFCHFAKVPCRIEKILRTIDRRNGSVKSEDPKALKYGDYAEVIIVPEQPVCVEPYNTYPGLARFALRID